MGKKYTASCARNLKLNVKTNGSQINQSLWDFAIQTDQEIEHQSPDIVAIGKGKKECKIIDIAVPGDQNIKVKELEKITKYQDLKLQVQKLWYV